MCGDLGVGELLIEGEGDDLLLGVREAAQEHLQSVSHHHFLNIYLYLQLHWLL